MNRRALMLSGVAATAVLAGCTFSTSNGVTSVTINLKAVNAYAQALQNGSNTLLSVPLITTAMGPATVALVKAAVAGISIAAAALAQQATGPNTLTFTANSIPAALASFQADAATINAAFGVVITAETGSLSSNIITTASAIQTVVSLVLALASSVMPVTVGAVAPAMPEAQALSILNASY